MKQRYVATFKDEATAVQGIERLRQLMYTNISQDGKHVFFMAFKLPSEITKRDIGALCIMEHKAAQ